MNKCTGSSNKPDSQCLYKYEYNKCDHVIEVVWKSLKTICGKTDLQNGGDGYFLRRVWSRVRNNHVPTSLTIHTYILTDCVVNAEHRSQQTHRVCAWRVFAVPLISPTASQNKSLCIGAEIANAICNRRMHGLLLNPKANNSWRCCWRRWRYRRN